MRTTLASRWKSSWAQKKSPPGRASSNTSGQM
nr:MAG TPA: hypothetical protein [Bacteriophage sp.]